MNDEAVRAEPATAVLISNVKATVGDKNRGGGTGVVVWAKSHLHHVTCYTLHPKYNKALHDYSSSVNNTTKAQIAQLKRNHTCKKETRSPPAGCIEN